MKHKVRDNFLVFGAPRIEQSEIDEVCDSLRVGWLGTGPKVAKFEDMFRQYIGTENAMAVNSCTAALHLSMLVTGLGPGDEVITTSMTFAATVNAIIHSGATPILADCDRETGLIDPQRIEDALTPKTRAIVPVHMYGRPCDMDSIMDIAERHDLIVIEDAAHAIETVYKGQKVGNIGHLTCFSFYVTKNVITGEGGMVTTNNSEFADMIKVYALHGMSKDAWKRFSDEGYKHYQVIFPGFKYNMMDLQAAIGIHQLQRVEGWLQRRNEIWRRYNEAFSELPVGLPSEDEPDTVHARHLYTLMIDKERCGLSRDEFMQQLYELNIGTGVHYIGVHLHPYYRERFGYQPEDFPNATWISERTVSIPISPKLTDRDIGDVINSVRIVCNED
ncbi:MAG: aminotransferase class I/II-fold pyridoxal phosphate-dependent enzyme [Anaerolineales bacterium]|nr:aminotransferase class I/II-fold pyridoxal phosphate-dependent enzyme [Anaerolineales bacterium]